MIDLGRKSISDRFVLIVESKDTRLIDVTNYMAIRLDTSSAIQILTLPFQRVLPLHLNRLPLLVWVLVNMLN